MLNNWQELTTNTRRVAASFAEANPKVFDAYGKLNVAATSGGALDAKTRELIAVAVAVTTRCDTCIASHASAARRAGATEAELAEALGTAIALNAGAAYVYSVRTMEAFSQFSPK